MHNSIFIFTTYKLYLIFKLQEICINDINIKNNYVTLLFQIISFAESDTSRNIIRQTHRATLVNKNKNFCESLMAECLSFFSHLPCLPVASCFCTTVPLAFTNVSKSWKYVTLPNLRMENQSLRFPLSLVRSLFFYLSTCRAKYSGNWNITATEGR